MLIRQRLYVLDLFTLANCFAVALSAVNRLRWRLFFITNLRRMIFVPFRPQSHVHGISRNGLAFLTTFGSSFWETAIE